MKIGFIGLGNMGAPMAANLAKAGHVVVGFDMADVTVEGVTLASSGAEAVAGADVAITMLPNGQILRSVADEIVPAMQKGATWIDCSTVDVESARRAHETTSTAGLGMIDCPVSGGLRIGLVEETDWFWLFFRLFRGLPHLGAILGALFFLI